MKGGKDFYVRVILLEDVLLYVKLTRSMELLHLIQISILQTIVALCFFNQFLRHFEFVYV